MTKECLTQIPTCNGKIVGEKKSKSEDNGIIILREGRKARAKAWRRRWK